MALVQKLMALVQKLRKLQINGSKSYMHLQNSSAMQRSLRIGGRHLHVHLVSSSPSTQIPA
jgi:hypothetical protein